MKAGSGVLARILCICFAVLATAAIRLRPFIAATTVSATSFSFFATSTPVHAIDAIDAALKNSQITYSNNAKNFARMSQGDYSQGSKDTSTSDRAVKRKAAALCKKLGLQESKPCFERVYSDDFTFMKTLVHDSQK